MYSRRGLLSGTVEEQDREGLEGLCRYGLRAPFSQQRLSVLPGGKVRYELARPWPTPTGVAELIMEPVQFLKRLAALLPASISPPAPTSTRGQPG